MTAGRSEQFLDQAGGLGQELEAQGVLWAVRWEKLSGPEGGDNPTEVRKAVGTQQLQRGGQDLGG